MAPRSANLDFDVEELFCFGNALIQWFAAVVDHPVQIANKYVYSLAAEIDLIRTEHTKTGSVRQTADGYSRKPSRLHICLNLTPTA